MGLDIADLPASRELDALVAEKVMGFTRVQNGLGEWVFLGEDSSMGGIPHYSTSIAAAWEVWEYLRRSGFWCCLTIRSDYHYCWRVELTPEERPEVKHGVAGDPHEPTIVVDGEESLPLSICQAALKAVGA